MNKSSILKLFIVFASTVIILGCKTVNTEKYSLQLIKSGTKEFALDDDTGPLSRSIAYYENSDGKYYLHFNMYKSKYLLFDYSTGRLIDKVCLNRLPSPDAASFISFDSILFIYDGQQNTLVLTDTANKIISRTDIKPNELKMEQSAVKCKNHAPIIFKEGKLFNVNMWVGASMIIGGKERLKHDVAVGGYVDYVTGVRHSFVFYPDVYFRASYGNINYNTVYSCFSDDAMIVSFPASDYLFKYSFNTLKTDSIKCTSDYFDKIKPLKKSRDYSSFNEEESQRYYASNSSWETVCYDKFRKIYYRFAGLPNTKREFDPKNTTKSLSKPLSIIILDKNLKKIGETYIGKGYDLSNVLTTPDGLLLRHLDKDESKAVYDIFKPVENE